MAVVDESKLRYLEFIQREDRVRHHTYVQEMRQYDLMKAGDPEAIRESVRMWDSGLYGHVSDDPVRNAKYLFVTSITLVTRFAIEGGMDEEDAYNASDLYIQDMDHYATVDEVRRLHTDMMTFFTWAMADLSKQDVQSRPIAECLDYIHYHLHEKITVAMLADHVQLNPTYLSELFKREVGVPVSQYITDRRMEAACNMLKYSQYSLAEIAQILAYRSQSHFTKVFGKAEGMTPKEYRDRYAKTGIWPE
ncbi:helix-turn-helix domain-containing protein [Bifidobacterium vespertilionis]|uniref:helix-turn-helix domain-containing protein n=1 Tax=Bifidobacterium vespertilionis TaxID=2562524 RepID=UPI001BDC1960|nr:helix-turn-helix domain-containing protein [Bifidobacterium vespertilionis]MBT1178253.1 AraC family transcriptional regulator [Bifidobacterium vespertilionis]